MEFCKTCLILRAFYLQSPLVLFLKKRCLRWHQFFISFWLLGCSNVLQQKKDGERQWRQCLIDTPTPIVIGFYLWRGVSVFVWERGLVSILERRRSKPTTNNLGSLHLGHPKEKKSMRTLRRVKRKRRLTETLCYVSGLTESLFYFLLILYIL